MIYYFNFRHFVFLHFNPDSHETRGKTEAQTERNIERQMDKNKDAIFKEKGLSPEFSLFTLAKSYF